ncbi:MAG TPA: hypothetical protein VFX69_10010 [Steroidobacteraceae bacterium]|jgi:hypothetical protein|nr:hypothetical protein [Steroidobacteraceae bacterium]
MTVREHSLELIHAEIDGELTGPQRAELNRLLLSDPVVRALRDELRRTCAAIDALADEEPPAGLHESIVASLPPAPVVSLAPPASGRPALRYAAAFAGGLLVSALAFQLGARQDTLSSHQLTGTIASVTVDASRLELHLDQVSGTIHLQGTPQSPIVEASLVASRPVQVIARLDDQEVRLTGFVAAQRKPVILSGGFDRVAAAGPAKVEISVVDGVSGDVLQTTTLRPTVAD